MRNVLILDICLVCSIVEDECIVLDGIVDPLAQLVAGNHRSRGVVGIAEIDDINPLVGQGGSEIVLGSAWHVCYIAPFAVITQFASTSDHHVGVDIHWINRVGHSDTVVPSH